MITLPGDIPGLLRRCSPLPDGDVVFAVDTKDGTALCGEVAQTDAGPLQGWVNLSDIDLDLTDATGRAHAGWYADDRVSYATARQVGRAVGARMVEVSTVIAWAMGNRDMSDSQIDLLRRIVLHVAGRT